MIKRLKQVLKDRKGFTLVEMITVIAVFAILSASVAMLLQPVLNIFYESTNLSRSSEILSNVLDMMEDQMLYADDKIISVSEWPPEEADVRGIKSAKYVSIRYGGVTLLTQDDNYPYIESEQINSVTGAPYVYSLGKEFYMKNRVKVGLQIDVAAPEIMCLNAAVYDSRGELIGKQSRYINLLNKPKIEAAPTPP